MRYSIRISLGERVWGEPETVCASDVFWTIPNNTLVKYTSLTRQHAVVYQHKYTVVRTDIYCKLKYQRLTIDICHLETEFPEISLQIVQSCTIHPLRDTWNRDFRKYHMHVAFFPAETGTAILSESYACLTFIYCCHCVVHLLTNNNSDWYITKQWQYLSAQRIRVYFIYILLYQLYVLCGNKVKLTYCTDGLRVQTRQAKYVQTVRRCTRNDCCRGKAISITHSDFLSVALVTQHSVRTQSTTVSSAVCVAVPIFLNLRRNQLDIILVQRSSCKMPIILVIF
jgi:hypothetical protein